MKIRYQKFKKELSHSFFLWLFTLITFSLFSQNYIPGTTYLDSNGYVEYMAGNLPFVISVPHGGYLKPASIPDRNCTGCSYIRDAYTQELARELQTAFVQKTGCYPHMVINLLHRVKFDANRDIGDAADGNPVVEQSWYAYHEFIDSSKARIERDYGRGLFLDLHGHGHNIQRIELGYLLSKTKLQTSDSNLNTNAIMVQSSIYTLVSTNLNSFTHAQLIRGDSSLGSLLAFKGFPAVPSAAIPYPVGSEPYFSGGYNTQRHNSKQGGAIEGIQMECNHDIRWDSLLRKKFADSLAEVLIDYYNIHYNNQFDGNYCSLLSIAHSTNTLYVKIFPNPSQGKIYVESNRGNLDIDIYNNLGQRVLSLKWKGKALDISSLEKGCYYLRFSKNHLLLGTRVLVKM